MISAPPTARKRKTSHRRRWSDSRERSSLEFIGRRSPEPKGERVRESLSLGVCARRGRRREYYRVRGRGRKREYVRERGLFCERADGRRGEEICLTGLVEWVY
eukprot:scaffold53621_cov30-Tisochrysis_lutea.AAC.1